MKKILTVLSCLLAGTLAWSSTCQTRVDANLNKSTEAKVRYCLMTEKEEKAQLPKGPEVIISDTYSVVYPKTKEKPTKQEPKEIKVYTAQEVNNVYFDRNTYPSFRNNTLPVINAKAENDMAMDTLYKQRGEKGYQKPKVIKSDKVLIKSAPVKTPSAQIQEAQALQNDPLAQPQNDVLPQGFQEEDFLGQTGFGYNATDPAFQQ